MKKTLVLLSLLFAVGCSSSPKDPLFTVEGEVVDVESSSIAIRIDDGRQLMYQLEYPHPDLNHLTTKGDHVKLALAISHIHYDEGREWDFRWLKVSKPFTVTGNTCFEDGHCVQYDGQSLIYVPAVQ